VEDQRKVCAYKKL
jgi:hypothetical protein